jgi:hypothetical protein
VFIVCVYPELQESERNRKDEIGGEICGEKRKKTVRKEMEKFIEARERALKRDRAAWRLVSVQTCSRQSHYSDGIPANMTKHRKLNKIPSFLPLAVKSSPDAPRAPPDLFTLPPLSKPSHFVFSTPIVPYLNSSSLLSPKFPAPQAALRPSPSILPPPQPKKKGVWQECEGVSDTKKIGDSEYHCS